MRKIMLLTAIVAAGLPVLAFAEDSEPADHAGWMPAETIARKFTDMGFAKIVNVVPAAEHYEIVAVDPSGETIRFHADPVTGDFIHRADEDESGS